MEQELAPSAIKGIAGCCSFKGPVPPPLTIRYKNVYMSSKNIPVLSSCILIK